MIKLDENLNFEISELKKLCNGDLDNKIFYDFYKNELVVSKKEINSIYIGYCNNLCNLEESKFEMIKDFIIFNRNKILEKLIFDELTIYYVFDKNIEKIKPAEELKKLSDMEFNLHKNYVMDMYNKIILGNKKTENLTTSENMLEDYVQMLNIENLKRSFQ